MLDPSAAQAREAAQLLWSVAEQLKMPLSVIARRTELVQITNEVKGTDLAMIHTQATLALSLVDSYLLGLQLLNEQAALELEPVSVSSLLVDTAHELDSFARQYGVRLELSVAGKYGPVMASRQGLRSALLALGYSLLKGCAQPEGRLKLAVHRTPRGIITGIYGANELLNAEEWRNALNLRGKAVQPLPSLADNGAGLFVAETILRAMSTSLRVGKYQNNYGLATTLQLSQQLSLV